MAFHTVSGNDLVEGIKVSSDSFFSETPKIRNKKNIFQK